MADKMNLFRVSWNYDGHVHFKDIENLDSVTKLDFARQLIASAGGENRLTVEQAWQDLVEKTDRTSPRDYPDHALITFDELADYMRSASSDTGDGAADGWQPIETAPKDGTWILGLTSRGKVEAARWINEDEHDAEYGTLEWGRTGGKRFRFIRWQPLPAAPSISIRSV